MQEGNKGIIIPSIASGNLLNIDEEIKFIDTNYGHIHIDIEDGNYIPNITFGTKLMELICENSFSSKSIHLMVNRPELFLKSVKKCNPYIVFIHVDVTRYPSELIRLYQDEGIRVGIAINPNIGVDSIDHVIPLTDDILILTSEPDGRGQKYIKAVENKICRLNDYKLNIWVDGGITEERIDGLLKIGVKNIVIGRAIFADRKRIIVAK